MPDDVFGEYRLLTGSGFHGPSVIRVHRADIPTSDGATIKSLTTTGQAVAISDFLLLSSALEVAGQESDLAETTMVSVESNSLSFPSMENQSCAVTEATSTCAVEVNPVHKVTNQKLMLDDAAISPSHDHSPPPRGSITWGRSGCDYWNK